jgi:hypothetical protein
MAVRTSLRRSMKRTVNPLARADCVDVRAYTLSADRERSSGSDRYDAVDLQVKVWAVRSECTPAGYDPGFQKEFQAKE